jgi:hypothetical protein
LNVRAASDPGEPEGNADREATGDCAGATATANRAAPAPLRAGNGELEDLRWVRTDACDAIATTIIQAAILDVLHQRLRGIPAAPKRMFYAWGRHNFLDA